LSEINKTLCATLLAGLFLSGCGPQEFDPITRAAIFGCIEIAEHPGYTNTERAITLEDAGCGRFSERAVGALVPEYRAERARIEAEEDAERAARRDTMWEACGERQVRVEQLETNAPPDPKARQEHEAEMAAATRLAAFFCRNLTPTEIRAATAKWTSKQEAHVIEAPDADR
jgi:hypothetical protein